MLTRRLLPGTASRLPVKPASCTEQRRKQEKKRISVELWMRGDPRRRLGVKLHKPGTGLEFRQVLVLVFVMSFLRAYPSLQKS